RLDESLNISGHDPHPLYRPLSRRPSTPAVAWQISRPPLPYSATNPGHTDAPPETSPASEYNPRPARMSRRHTSRIAASGTSATSPEAASGAPALTERPARSVPE